MELKEKENFEETLKNIIYNLIMEKTLSEREKKIIEEIVKEKKYP